MKKRKPAMTEAKLSVEFLPEYDGIKGGDEVRVKGLTGRYLLEPRSRQLPSCGSEASAGRSSERGVTVKKVEWPEGIISLVAVVLNEDEYMSNPSSTKHDIYGPCRVLFTRHPDGGIDWLYTRTAKEPK